MEKMPTLNCRSRYLGPSLPYQRAGVPSVSVFLAQSDSRRAASSPHARHICSLETNPTSVQRNTHTNHLSPAPEKLYSRGATTLPSKVGSPPERLLKAAAIGSKQHWIGVQP